MSNDCLVGDAVDAMLLELRQQRPPVYLADEREIWLSAIGAFISNMRDTQQRVKAIDAVALDLYAAYGMNREMASFVVAVAVFSAEEREHADR